MTLWAPVLQRTAERPTRTFSSNWEIFDEWRDSLKAKSRNVRAHYPVYLRVFMEMWEGTLVTTLTATDLQLFLDKVSTKCAKLMRSNPPHCLAGRDLQTCPLLRGGDARTCPKYQALDINSQKSYLTAVNSLYEWLLRERHIQYNPLAAVQAKFFEENRAKLQKRRRNPRRRALKNEEVEVLVNALPIHLGVVVALMAMGFMRIHEAMKISLDPKFFNLAEGWILIPDDPDYGDKRIGNNRVIITPALRSVLNKYFVWRERKVLRNPDGTPRTDKIVLTTFGLPWCPNGFQGNYKTQLHKHCIRLGLMTGQETQRSERVNPHCFRAWATTWALEHGANYAQVGVLRGDKAPGAIGEYDELLRRLPDLYRQFGPQVKVNR